MSEDEALPHWQALANKIEKWLLMSQRMVVFNDVEKAGTMLTRCFIVKHKEGRVERVFYSGSYEPEHTSSGA